MTRVVDPATGTAAPPDLAVTQWIWEELHASPDGLLAPEITQLLGCSHRSVLRALVLLAEDGAVRRRGRRWFCS